MKKVEMFRVDNSGKYRGPFEQYCRFHTIKLEKIVIKTL